MQYSIKKISYEDFWMEKNSQSLLDEYADECSIPGIGKAIPQKEMYAMMEKSGALQGFAAYRDEMLVGFAAVLIYVLPHYGKKIASTESIFVSKKYNGAGRELMEFIEKYAKENGCVAFLYSALLNSRFDRLLSVTANRTNSVYMRSLV